FLAPHHGREHLRYAPSINGALEVNSYRAISSHCQRRAQFTIEIGIADADCGHFHLRSTLLSNVQSFFERDGVKRIDNVHQSCVFDSRSVRADADPFVSRRNTLSGNKNLHFIVEAPSHLMPLSV